MLPIYDNRAIVSHAKNEKHAVKILRAILQNVPPGWIIDVRRRNTAIIDLPAGFVYCIRP